MLLDIQGAFDNVRTDKIVRALNNHKYPRYISRWMTDYLTNRMSIIDVKGETDAIALTGGTPQGGVLSPLLWNLTFDSFLEKFNTDQVKCFGFADDACLLVQGVDPIRTKGIMQMYLNEVQIWGEQNGLLFSPKKTEAMFLTRQNRFQEPGPLVLAGKNIEYKTEARYLGVIVDSRLGWTSHLKSRVASAKKILSVLTNGIGRLWEPKPKYIKWIYMSVITPIITYGAVVWSAICQRQTAKKELQKLQNQIIRRIAYTRKSTPMRAAALILGLVPLHIEADLEAKRTLLRHSAEQGLPSLINRNLTKFRTHIEWLSQRIPFPAEEMEQTDRERPVSIRPAYETKIDKNPCPHVTEGDITVYTDGSKHDQGTGAGFCYWTMDDREVQRHGIRLERDTSIFRAEMAAIKMATEHIEREVLPK